MKRIFLIVLDSCGAGEMPDAAKFGDFGVNTLKSCSTSSKLHIPTMVHCGLGNIEGLSFLGTDPAQTGACARMAEASMGKDTTIGHWEIAGLISPNPLPTYPNGFPEEVLKPFREATGRGVLANAPWSGTEVIQKYGAEHMKTGDLIVYTSADSVFQIAAHEDIVPLEQLYEYCRIARSIMQGEDAVGRIIARPFVGEDAEHFTRTANRRDFSLLPPQDTLLDCLQKTGLQTIGVGKISDIFAGKGISQKIITHSNDEGIQRTLELCNSDFEGLCFVNLVEFDMLYGHRNDPVGYAQALSRFDSQLEQLLGLLREEDLLFITADHGCDPSTPSTDHSREYVPLLCCGKSVRAGVDLATRSCFADLAATVGEYFDPAFPGKLQAGSSFLQQILI